jgi:hypothetical protein
MQRVRDHGVVSVQCVLVILLDAALERVLVQIEQRAPDDIGRRVT